MIASTTSAPTTGSALAASTTPLTGGSVMGKDQFLKLLITQMQNQDPMNPMDGSQMAAQLAQFSSLEQLQQINTTLTDQGTSQGSLLGAIQASSAINTMGHTVVAAGNELQIGGANSATTVMASLSNNAASGTLHIFNSTGQEVGTSALGATSSGKQTFDLGDATKGLPDGTYTYSIDAKDSAGGAVAVQTYMSGKVDGISTSQNGIMLTAGGMSIPYASVIQVIN